METISSLRKVAKAYSTATGLSFKTISSRVFNDGKKLDAVMAGETDLTTARFDLAMTWFAENWPDGAKWPAGVPAPSALRAAS